MLAAAAVAAPAQAGDEPALKFSRTGVIGTPHIEDNHVEVGFTLSTKRGVVGTSKLRCRIVKRPPQRCSNISTFREGVIRARGVSKDNADKGTSKLPIVGGSGPFRGAKGELTIKYTKGVEGRFIYRLDSLG